MRADRASMQIPLLIAVVFPIVILTTCAYLLAPTVSVPLSTSRQLQIDEQGLDVRWLDYGIPYSNTVVAISESPNTPHLVSSWGNMWDAKAADFGKRLCGYCNDLAELVIPMQYQSAKPFCNGYAFAEGLEHSWLIDVNGVPFLDCSDYTYAAVLDDGNILTTKHFPDKFGLLDANGNELLPSVYRSIRQIRENTYILEMKDYWFVSSYGLCNSDGSLLTKIEYENIFAFAGDDKAPIYAQLNGLYG